MTDPRILADARRVADTVLYEGYLLYPYRASSAKNQLRWQFGVLGPVGAADAGAGEPAHLATACLLQVGPSSTGTGTGFRLDIHVRFLQVQSRQVEEIVPEQVVGPVRQRFRAVDELHASGRTWVTWQEAVEQEVVVGGLSVDDLLLGRNLPVYVPGGQTLETVTDAAGHPVGRLVRTRRPLEAALDLRAAPLDAADVASRSGRYRLEIRLTNEVRWSALPAPDPHDPPDRAARHERASENSLVGAHLLLTLDGGTFASVIDPPEGFEAAAQTCRFDRCWPVLIGAARFSPVVLAAPIILEDRPAIAPESPGDLFDATEIDEILTLRVQTLTEDEKAAARATDPRAAAILDRCDGLTEAEMTRLHGVLRDPGAAPASPEDTVPWWDPEADASVDPGTDTVRVAGVPVARGSRVLLRPSRRADAQDLFLAGQVAIVAGVHSDVDGATHVAVTLEDDPAADLHDWYGRYYYFGPEELEPLTPEAAPHHEDAP
jgi:hypothetical protein